MAARDDDDRDVMMDMEHESDIDISREGVLQKLQEQHPGITSIVVNNYSMDRYRSPDSASLGKAVDNSLHLKKLSINLWSVIYPYAEKHANMMTFCRQLVTNNTIEWLELWMDYNSNNFPFSDNESMDRITGGWSGKVSHNEDIFRCLASFFENNTQLSKFTLNYKGNITVGDALIGALLESTTLKDVCIKKFPGSLSPWQEPEENNEVEFTQTEEELLYSIIDGFSLTRLSFNGVLQERSCTYVKDMLVDPECQVTNLELGEYVANPSLIAQGLAENKSVQHIVYSGIDFILMNSRPVNQTLQTLDLSRSRDSFVCDEEDRMNVNLPALASLGALKSLNLSRRFLRTGTMNAIIKAVVTPISKLEDLNLADGPSCSDSEGSDTGFRSSSLKILASCMSKNESLKSLSLKGARAITPNAYDWKQFFENLKTSNLCLESIDLLNTSMRDTDLFNFRDFVISCSTLKKFDVNTCSASGWATLLPVLHQTSIEELQILNERALLHYNEFPISIRDLLVNGQLKKLVLGPTVAESMESYQSILNVLDSPNCCLEEVSFTCDFENNEQQMTIMSEWIQLLGTNTTLKKLAVHCNVIGPPGHIWDQFGSLLCNEDSIDATFNSNHTLQWLSIDYSRSRDTKMPLDILLYLMINQNANKTERARRKVMMIHFNDPINNSQKLIDLNLGLKKMPQFVNWIGREQIDLNLMYGFIRGMPALVEGATRSKTTVRKRKVELKL
eukprot:scaffold12956_cov71-Cyclotella_meneghiniana.AAC.9